jgi:predicted ATPase/class 3 adenylate cyclase
MVTDERPAFGEMLRRARVAAGLSQEELAERAGLSARGISDLERGARRVPRRDTVELLAAALGLAPEERARLAAAIRRPSGAAPGPGSPDPDLPGGMVTFLLTDVEGSTPLWQQHPVAMRAALVRHDALVESLTERHRGRVVRPRGEGDSRFCVFARATDAVAAALAIQRALGSEVWPTPTPVRVRMALDVGEADLRGGDYYGTAVNRCARLRELARGGQVLLSEVVHELVADLLPAGASLRDLGARRLRGLSRPNRVFALEAEGLAAGFPPLASSEAPPNNLPAQASSFVGREREIADLERLVAAARLVTLTGPGGTGKTRLALEMAARLLERFPDGAWFVDLAPLTDPRLVWAAAAAALGVREGPARPLDEVLLGHVASRRLLLMLDNCEHVIAESADLAQRLLAAGPEVRVLATSREALAVPGEAAWPVPGLSLPDAGQPAGPEAIGHAEAVRLFVERGAAVRPGFALSEENAAAVARVCRRLDGLPLAIELAAARIKALTPEQIAARLDDRFRLLTGGSRTALPRQQTLRAAVDWSYDLLDVPERALLARLAVFAGGWTLEAAEAVCADAVLPADAVLDLLLRLVDKSLVVAEEHGAAARYRMLETIREYAAARLAETGRDEAPRARHAAHYLALAEAAEPGLTGPSERSWLEQLECEHDNLRAAMQWAVASGEGELGLRMGGALWRFWAMRGHLAEGRRRLSALLAHPNCDALSGSTGAARAKALHAAGTLAAQQGDNGAARSYLEASIAARRVVGARSDLANSLSNLGIVTRSEGDYATARALYAESLAIHRELGNKSGIAHTLANLGLLARFQGDGAAARPLLEESLAIRRELGDPWAIANALNNLAEVALDEGDHASARALLEQSLRINQELGDRRAIAFLLEDFGALAAAQGQAGRALRLVGAAAALRASVGSPLSALEQAKLERALRPTDQALDEPARDALLAEGRATPIEAAVAYALAADESRAAQSGTARPTHRR